MNRIVLIGNSEYDNYGNLKRVSKDIQTMEKIFSAIGYDIQKYVNFTYSELLIGLEEFAKHISSADNVIIYFSGHGFHKDGHNFIILKDSSGKIGVKAKVDMYEDVYKVFDVVRFSVLNQYNKKGNTLVIIDACRNNGLTDFEVLKEAKTEINDVWQLYSTSIGKYSYANGLFVKAIESVIYRQGQNVSELYESIRIYIQQKCFEKEWQIPILISGKSNFIIVNELNNVIEEKYYTELVKLHQRVKVIEKKYIFPYSEDNIIEMTELLTKEVYCPFNRMKENIKKILGHDSNLGILDLLFEQKLKQVVVFENYFMIHGICSNYYFDNNELYDYDKCWKHILSHSKPIGMFQYKYGKITCINSEPCSSEKVFTLIFNKGERNLEYYLEQYFGDNIKEVKEKKETLREIFSQKRSLFVAGRASIKKQPFIQGLLNEYLGRYHRVCELVYLTQFEEVNFVNERFQFVDIFENPVIYEEFVDKMRNKCYDWIIIPIMGYHESYYKEIGIAKLMEIETVAKENNISFLFYTDFLEEALTIMNITKQALPFVEYIICLNEDMNNKHAYIESIRMVD